MRRVVTVAMITAALLGSATAPTFARDHHHHDTGRIIAGSVAAGVVGGLIGGAIADQGPRYSDPPPPRPRCWYEDRNVQNTYDDGYHAESVRVCN